MHANAKHVSAYQRLQADLMGGAELSGLRDDIKMQVDRAVAQLPSQTYVEQYCRAPEMAA